MKGEHFSYKFSVPRAPGEVFDKICLVSEWWSTGVEGALEKPHDEFTVHFGDNFVKLEITQMILEKRIAWLVKNCCWVFLEQATEWNGTMIIWDIKPIGNATRLCMTHTGLTPQLEGFETFREGWELYIGNSLFRLITENQGIPFEALQKPNCQIIKTKNMTPTIDKTMTTQEIAARFNELAREEKWFEIQDELFADNVKSIDPDGSPYFGYAEGKAAVRKKGEDFVSRITDFHGASTSEPVVAGNHFAVGREVDVTVEGHGRIQIKEIMLYEIKNGRIISEQFFY